jgi:Ca2+-binding EF-hand superfamily protein
MSLLLLCAALAAAARAGAAPAPRQADAVFAALDADHDQALSREEFAAGYARVQQAIEVEARLHRQFGVVDANRDGALDGAEYAKLVLVARLGASAPALATFDADADGRLGFDEYRNVVRRLAPAAKE